jgi:glycosyltransferase involved in cell wall biosynthesis
MTPQPSTSARPDVSVVLCTFNRSALLADAVSALLRQADAPPYEVIVVDNNSTDDTRQVAEQFTGDSRVRYVREPAQGVSHARNLGAAIASAEILAFTDDDVRVGPLWIQSIARAFGEHPDVDMIGGKVEPEWQAEPPAWLRQTGDAPLALVDYGTEPFRITPAVPRCLITANVAVRRRSVERLRGFSPRLQRVRDGIGSTEDHDFQTRLLETGAAALYDPRIVARTIVPPERLSKRYHRAWHQGHGRFYALMRDPLFERSRTGALLGVPAHVYRSAVTEAFRWAVSLLRGRASAAFAHELRLRFLMAFARQRIVERP